MKKEYVAVCFFVVANILQTTVLKNAHSINCLVGSINGMFRLVLL